MSLYVVDSNVILKWYIPEPLSDKADAFLDRAQASGDEVITPDFTLIELSNILWKKRRMKELQDKEVFSILDALLNRLGVRLVDSNLFIVRAVEIAMMIDCSVYDALYLAVAELYNASFITADQKLVTAVHRYDLSHQTKFLGTF